MMRFPSAVKVLKPSKSGTTPAKVPLKQTTLPMADAAAPKDSILSDILYTALKKLRTDIVKESSDAVMAHHIFGNATLQQISKRLPRTKEELLDINGLGKAKVSKYGDRLLETIESNINCHYGIEKNEGPGSGKRRRDENISPNLVDDDDPDWSSSQSHKKAVENK